MNLRWISLKTKLVLYSLAIFITLVPATAYFSIDYFRHHYQESIEQQQYLLVNRIAGELDSKISSSQKMLIRASGLITSAIITNPVLAEQFLENRVEISSVFDNGLYLFTPDGKIVAETIIDPPRVGADFSFREYIIKTIDTHKPYISAPYISSQKHKHPSVMFTVPLIDEKDALIGILAGSIDLMRENFLGLLSTAKIGTSGYFYLSTQDRNMIMHPDKSRIMTKTPEGLNIMYDRAIGGFEGSNATVNSKGITFLTSFKRLSTTQWILAANYPVSEAFAPVKNAALTAWIIVGVGALFTALVFWFVMAKLISPIESLNYQIKNIHEETNPGQHVTVSTNDEVGELADSFNLLFGKLGKREDELEQHVKLRTAQLEATNRELDSFSYSVSHDLRGPIRHIEGYSRILAEDHSTNLDVNASELLQRILRSCQKMNELINALLGLSRLNQSEISLASVNLSLIAADVVNSLRQAEPDCQVEVNIADNMKAIADISLIRVALENLFGNAWKYTRNNKQPIITFDFMEQDGHIVFFVRDNGAGFDMRYAEDLFAPFRRLHRDSEFEGIGIGLATVQRIIHRHGGKIWAEGSIGGGATFFFSLNYDLGCQ